MKKLQLSKGMFALVDDDMLPILGKHKWTADSKGYAFRSEKRSETGLIRRRIIMLHRVIMEAPPTHFVDHINGNTLDNRRCNLRLATRSQNARNRQLQVNNRTGYKGVWFNKRTGLFVATIKLNGMSRTIKSFKTAIEAAEAYNEAAARHYGEFARLNEL